MVDFVPRLDESEDSRSRPGQAPGARKVTFPENACDFRAPIDHGGFFEVRRDAGHESAQCPDREGDHARQVHDSPTGRARVLNQSPIRRSSRKKIAEHHRFARDHLHDTAPTTMNARAPFEVEARDAAIEARNANSSATTTVPIVTIRLMPQRVDEAVVGEEPPVVVEAAAERRPRRVGRADLARGRGTTC